MRTLSHLTVKNWPETKGSQADKYSRLGLGKVWGFLYAHVTFEAVFWSLIPLAIWHIRCLCFSFLNFFFFFWKYNSGFSSRKGGTRRLQALLGGLRARLHRHRYRPSPRLGRGSWPRSQTTQGQRGESRWGPRAPGPHLLSRPVPESGFQKNRFPNTPLILWVNAGRQRKAGKPACCSPRGHDWTGTHSGLWPASGGVWEPWPSSGVCLHVRLARCNDPRGHKPCSMRCPGHACGARRLGQ